MFKTSRSQQNTKNFSPPNITVKAVGLVYVLRIGDSQLRRKQVWSSLISPDRILFTLTPEETERSERTAVSSKLQTLPWEMITLQPSLQYDELYTLDLSDLPSADLSPEMWGLPEISSPVGKGKYFCYNISKDITLRQEKDQNPSPASFDELVQGVGITFERHVTA